MDITTFSYKTKTLRDDLVRLDIRNMLICGVADVLREVIPKVREIIDFEQHNPHLNLYVYAPTVKISAGGRELALVH